MKNLLLLILIFLILSSTVFAFAQSNDIDALIKQSFNEIKAKNYEQANFLVDKVLELDPNNIDALNNKAVILANFGEISKAHSYIDKALEIDENHILSLSNKSILLEGQGNYYDAIPYFIKILELDPNLSSVREKLAFAVEKSVKKKLIDGMIQITVRNSDGILVAHYFSTYFIIPDHEITKYYIKKFFEKKTIIQDSNKVEVLYQNLSLLITEDTELGLWHVTHPQAGLKLAFAKTPMINLKQGDTVMADFYIFSLD